MRASIIYTVAASVVLISTFEVRLGQNNFGKKGSSSTNKINSSLKLNESQKATISFANRQLDKIKLNGKKNSPLVIVKPELVLEEFPTVMALVATVQKSNSFESAIIEDTQNDETKALDFDKINALSNMEEAIELPIMSNNFSNNEYKLNQEYAIIEEVDQNETNSLDFNWVNTIAMYDEVIVSYSSKIENSALDFNIIGEDDALTTQPLDFNWIETLQMFDEPILTPQQLLTE